MNMLVVGRKLAAWMGRSVLAESASTFVLQLGGRSRREGHQDVVSACAGVDLVGRQIQCRPYLDRLEQIDQEQT